MTTNKRIERITFRLEPADEEAVAAIEQALRTQKRFVTRTDVMRTALREGLRARQSQRTSQS